VIFKATKFRAEAYIALRSAYAQRDAKLKKAGRDSPHWCYFVSAARVADELEGRSASAVGGALSALSAPGGPVVSLNLGEGVYDTRVVYAPAELDVSAEAYAWVEKVKKQDADSRRPKGPAPRCACCGMSMNSVLVGKPGGPGVPLCHGCQKNFPGCDCTK
jgi:hypothetical protein